MTIVTFLWGGWCGSWGEEYVVRLLNGLRRGLKTGMGCRGATGGAGATGGGGATGGVGAAGGVGATGGLPASASIDFAVFADCNLSSVSARPVPPEVLEWPGCLPKFYALDPRHKFSEPVIIMDLDAVVLGDLRFLAEPDLPLILLQDFYRRDPFPTGAVAAYRNVEGWADRLLAPIYADPKRVGRLTGGSEREWLARQVPAGEWARWQDLYPGRIVSFKAHCKGAALDHRASLESEAGKIGPGADRPPADARLVLFHGRPRPHEVCHLPWMREHWK